MGDVFCTAALWFTGDTSKALATVGVSITGLGALLGRLTWGLAMFVGIGVSVVFVASTIVDDVSGGIQPVTCPANILNKKGG
jgi:type IV secretory pathway VirB2 component (pilin)